MLLQMILFAGKLCLGQKSTRILLTPEDPVRVTSGSFSLGIPGTVTNERIALGQLSKFTI